MGEVQQSEPRAWLPAPMLGGKPLIDDASIRNYNGGIGYHVASALEETLLLPKDMVELRGLRRNEVFLQAKRCLGMVCIVLFSTPPFFLLGITLISCYLCVCTLLLLHVFFCVYFVVVFFPLFFLNRLFKVRSGWKKFIIPSHSSWMRREEEGSLLCRR